MSCDFVVLKFYLPNFRAYLYPDIQNLNWKSVDFITKQQDKSSVKTNHNWIIVSWKLSKPKHLIIF